MRAVFILLVFCVFMYVDVQGQMNKNSDKGTVTMTAKGSFVVTTCASLASAVVGTCLFGQKGALLGAIAGGYVGYAMTEEFNTVEAAAKAAATIGGAVMASAFVGVLLFGRKGYLLGGLVGGAIGYTMSKNPNFLSK